MVFHNVTIVLLEGKLMSDQFGRHLSNVVPFLSITPVFNLLWFALVKCGAGVGTIIEIDLHGCVHYWIIYVGRKCETFVI